MLGAGNVFSATDCTGVPSAVKMGEYGNQEAYVIVRIGDVDYRLGRFDDDAAKVRLTIVQSALMSQEQVKLRFFNVNTCGEASSNKEIPNSTQIIK